MRCRHRLSKLLLRHGIRFDDGAAWTQRHRDWLATVQLGWPAAQVTMLDARGAIDALAHRRDQLEREIAGMLPGSPWAVQVGRLRCLRGIDTLSAVGLCSEIADFERFARSEQLMSYVGPGAVREHDRSATPARCDHQDPALGTPAGSWSKLPGTTASDSDSSRSPRREPGAGRQDDSLAVGGSACASNAPGEPPAAPCG